MRYYVRSSTSSERWVPRSLEEYKVENQLMYLPFGGTEKKALPEFTVENMGVPEKVNWVG